MPRNADAQGRRNCHITYLLCRLVKNKGCTYSKRLIPSASIKTDAASQDCLPLIFHFARHHVLQLGIERRHRLLAISLALLITLAMLMLLVAFGPLRPAAKADKSMSVVNFSASTAAADSVDDSPPAAQPQPQSDPTLPQPQSQQVMQAPSDVALPVVLPEPLPTPPLPSTAERPAPPAAPKIGVRMRDGASAGPPSKAAAGAGDTARVGTAPNGEPLYAAAWYREPTDGELRGYLSTAHGPGWGLVACRTVADYRVEDCVALEEYPAGSMMNRAVLAAAWQFRVRPPRLGGKPQVGTWVRIRIDYR